MGKLTRLGRGLLMVPGVNEIMSLPKMLPWYARKAGVPEARAAVLWNVAVRNADLAFDAEEIGGNDYWRHVLADFHLRMGQESACLAAITGQRRNPLSVRAAAFIYGQARIAAVTLDALARMGRIARRLQPAR